MKEYVIDGYNVLLSGLRGKVADLEKQREEFIRRVARLAAGGNEAFTLVFDADRERGLRLPAVHRRQNLEIVYAVNSNDADEEIKRHVEEHDFPHEVTVISSDNSVRGFTRAMGAQSMHAREFWGLLETLDAPKAAKEADGVEPHKKDLGKLTPGEVDDWLDYFGGDDVATDSEA